MYVCCAIEKKVRRIMDTARKCGEQLAKHCQKQPDSLNFYHILLCFIVAFAILGGLYMWLYFKYGAGNKATSQSTENQQ
jgi:hypothetical protein